MTQQKIKNELQNIISGISSETGKDPLKATQSFLAGNERSGTEAKTTEYSREQEEKDLEKYLEDNNFWYTTQIKEEDKIGSGAEQTVYRTSDNSVIKLNDAIFLYIVERLSRQSVATQLFLSQNILYIKKI